MTNYDDEPTKVEMLLSEINNTESLLIAVFLNPCLFVYLFKLMQKLLLLRILLVLKKLVKIKSLMIC